VQRWHYRLQCDWELPKSVVDWAQFLGALFSLFAVIAALIAMGKAKRDLRDERHRQHELDILRDIAKCLHVQDFGGFKWSEDLAPLLLMLPDNDLPLTRVALNMPTTSATPGDLEVELDKVLTEELWKEVQAPPDSRAPFREDARGQRLVDIVSYYQYTAEATFDSWRARCRKSVEVRLFILARPSDMDGSSCFSREVTRAIANRVKT